MCVGAPAGAFSEPKIAPPRVFPQPKYKLWRNGTREGGIEPGTSAGPPDQVRGPLHEAVPISEFFLCKDLLCIKNKDCMYQKYRVCASAPAGAFCQPKLATPGSFSTESSSFCIFKTDPGDF